ncbi:MAG: thioredoxin [Phycisphaerales bacterium]|nr:thioredoxin [Planctomycetota bacterium]MCH8509883.1 thioredoxin [Phycisphaerales bacterium]
MANPHVKAFTDDNFDQEVLKADAPVVVDFWAEWCMPCKVLGPTIDELAEKYAGKAVVGKMDIDAHKEAASRYGISAIPTVIIFKDGQVARKFVGLTNKEDLAAAIDALA